MSCLHVGASRNWAVAACLLWTLRFALLIRRTRPATAKPGEVGELWSKGPPNLIGYYKQPDVTAEKVTSDGFVKSGDLVYADEQGLHLFPGTG